MVMLDIVVAACAMEAVVWNRAARFEVPGRRRLDGASLHAAILVPAEILKELEDMHVDYLVFDTSEHPHKQQYWTQIDQLIKQSGDRLERV